MSHNSYRQSCSLRLKMLYGDYKYLFIFSLVLFLLFALFSRHAHILIASLQYVETMETFPQLATFLVLFIIVCLPFAWGYIILNVGAGFLYGFVRGTVLVSVCTAVGLTVVHALNRFCLVSWLKSTVTRRQPKLTSILNLLATPSHALKIVMLSRLTPFPFGVINALFALSDVGWVTYVGGSVIGLVPTQAVNAYIGTTLRTLEEVTSHKPSHYIILAVQLVVSLGLSSLVLRLAKQKMESEIRNQEKHTSAGVTSDTVTLVVEDS